MTEKAVNPELRAARRPGQVAQYPGPRASIVSNPQRTHPCRMRDHVYFVYVLASGRNGTLYVGVTSDLVKRIQEHREGLVPGFTRKYGVKALVYWEVHHDINEAIRREKRIKRWHRKWKLELIETANPQWRDLWFDLTQD
jgi:putative endonuclease